MESVRFTTFEAREVEDALLDQLSHAPDEGRSSFGVLGSPQRGGESEECPFDLECIAPRAISLRKLWEAAGQPIPGEVVAALGPQEPILVQHGMTPFHRAHAARSNVWGMGYRAEPVEATAHTIAVAPSSETLELARVDQSVTLGLAAGGTFGVPGFDAKPIGVPLQFMDTEVSASTDQRFGLHLRFSITARTVLAAPVGAGGARWSFYDAGENLDHFHPMFQTLLVPRRTRDLRVRVTTWIRRSRRWLGLVKAREWTSQATELTISLHGL